MRVEVIMPRNASYDLYCPQCKKKADVAMPMFIRYSIQRLELPIFLCSSCRTIYVDEPTVHRIVGSWRKNGAFTSKMSFRQLYQEFLGELERLVTTYFVPRLGYKRVCFLKRFTKPKP